MNQVEKSIQNLTKEIGSKTVFVAVSSGVDSTLLLDLASQYFDVIALHVNYKLRDKESDKDQDFLEEFCSQRNIPIQIKVHDLKSELKEKSANLQNRAREIRYAFFRENLDKTQPSVLFVGHHSNDQIETFFIQFYRNSGIAGLAGMKEQEGHVFRPFLQFSKKELLICAEERNLFWREDQSNSKNVYVRNRFRNEIIPELEKNIPELKQSVLKIMHVLQENQDIIAKETSLLIDELRNKNTVSLSEVNQWGDERIIELFRQLNVPSGFLSEFKKLMLSKKGARLDFPAKSNIGKIIRETDSLFFEFKKFRFECKLRINSSIVFELPKVFTKEKLYLDAAKIDGELHIRKWQTGDRIFPIGIKGSKLISDVLTDSKVLNANRQNQWVLCDESKIISCIGFCIDRRAIATNATEIIKCVEIEHISSDSINSL